MARLDSIDERLVELRQLAGDSSRVRVMDAHTGITAEEFAGLPLGIRRALVAACYTIRVLPASKRGPGFRTEDVELTVPGVELMHGRLRPAIVAAYASVVLPSSEVVRHYPGAPRDRPGELPPCGRRLRIMSA